MIFANNIWSNNMFLLNSFCREICVNNRRIRVVNNMNEMLHYINKFNGNAELHTTVYSFEAFEDNRAVYKTAVIDKIFIDIDDHNLKGESIDVIVETRKLVSFLYDKKIMFSVNFSGRGTHVYIYTKIEYLNNKSEAIINFVMMLKNKLDIIIDTSVVGDLARETRLINTINTKSGLYCIPLKFEEVMNLNIDDVRNLAKNRRELTKDFLYGKFLLSLKKFDGKVYNNDENHTEYLITNGDLKITFDKFREYAEKRPCLNDIIEDDMAGYDARTLLLIFMKNKGYSENEMNSILKLIISKEKWEKSECTRKHAHNVSSYPYIIKSCKKIANIGLCPLAGHQKDCRYFNNILSEEN
jgi:hypothetical protein